MFCCLSLYQNTAETQLGVFSSNLPTGKKPFIFFFDGVKNFFPSTTSPYHTRVEKLENSCENRWQKETRYAKKKKRGESTVVAGNWDRIQGLISPFNFNSIQLCCTQMCVSTRMLERGWWETVQLKSFFFDFFSSSPSPRINKIRKSATFASGCFGCVAQLRNQGLCLFVYSAKPNLSRKFGDEDEKMWLADDDVAQSPNWQLWNLSEKNEGGTVMLIWGVFI